MPANDPYIMFRTFYSITPRIIHALLSCVFRGARSPKLSFYFSLWCPCSLEYPWFGSRRVQSTEHECNTHHYVILFALAFVQASCEYIRHWKSCPWLQRYFIGFCCVSVWISQVLLRSISLAVLFVFHLKLLEYLADQVQYNIKYNGPMQTKLHWF